MPGSPFIRSGGDSAPASDGIPALDRETLALKAELEERHWWYRGRDLVLDALLAAPRLPDGARVLDAGCGSGYAFRRLSAHGEVAAVDANPAAVRFARTRGYVAVEEASIEELPFAEESFDLVSCLDVLEHVADDARAAAELRRVTRPGGLLVLCAPVYPRLFSTHDLAAGHRRRYIPAGLRTLLGRAGWRIERATHFNALLLAPAALRRLLGRASAASGATGEPRSDLLLTPPWADGALLAPFRLEAAWVRGGGSFPVGLSLIVIARRP